MIMRKVLTAFFFISGFLSCTKNDSTVFLTAASYYPLQSGRVSFYKLDSTVVSPFGTALIVRSYHLKDSIGISFQDNTGRESWPVYRFITDTLEQNSWRSLSTYFVTPANNNIEVVDDNNLRFIKLVGPVSNGKSWPGNSYIDTRTFNSPFQYLDDWTYAYDSLNMPFTTLAGTIDSSVTVLQRDETSPEGAFDPQFYQQRNYSVEVYAHNIGLIYKNFLHWTWQPTPEPAGYQDDSYGITLNLLRVKQ